MIQAGIGSLQVRFRSTCKHQSFKLRIVIAKKPDQSDVSTYSDGSDVIMADIEKSSAVFAVVKDALLEVFVVAFGIGDIC